VASSAKAEARQLVVDAVKTKAYGKREVMVRINALHTVWGADDVAAVARSPGIDAVVLPKVESAADVLVLERLLISHGAPTSLGIACMIETPRGVLKAEEIAGASSNVTCLVVGTADLAKDMRYRHTAGREPMLASLSMCILAARAHGVAVLDGVHLDLHDDAGLRDQCRQGCDMGFDGKTLIHPRQIAAANEAFGPTPAEVEKARQTILAFEAATAEGKGCAVVDGRLVENLHADAARAVLAFAHAIKELGHPTN